MVTALEDKDMIKRTKEARCAAAAFAEETQSPPQQISEEAPDDASEYDYDNQNTLSRLWKVKDASITVQKEQEDVLDMIHKIGRRYYETGSHISAPPPKMFSSVVRLESMKTPET